MPFKPGKSGNPSGRPKSLVTLQELAKTQTVGSLNTLVAIRDNDRAPESARVSAAVALLDRAWGKPGQTIGLGQSPDLGPLIGKWQD